MISILLFSMGNIGVLWGEKYVPSGLASLIVALVPIWVVMIEAWIFRAGRMTAKGLFGLAVGMVGLLVLLWPRIASGTHLGRLELLGLRILAGASFFWALGSVFSHRYRPERRRFCLRGVANDAGRAGEWRCSARLRGQFQRTRWTVPALSAIGYLIVFGSWIGYSAYIYLLEHVPTPKVATYAYVNPIVALFLGWLILQEQVDVFMLVGTVIIIASVALVNTSKLKHAPVDIPVKRRDVPEDGECGGRLRGIW